MKVDSFSNRLSSRSNFRSVASISRIKIIRRCTFIEHLQKDHVIALKDREINGLKEMILLLLQRRKYAPKSERDPRQSDMFNEIEAIADEIDDIEDSEEAKLMM